MKPIIGTRDIDSVPPATYASPMPMAIEPAAVWMACMAEPQKRFTVAPPTLRGRPASTPTMRPTFMPCSPSGKAQPMVDVLDRARVDAAALHQRAHDLAAELVGAGAGQLAAVGRLERRADVAGDDDAVGHDGVRSATERRTGVAHAGSSWAAQ